MLSVVQSIGGAFFVNVISFGVMFNASVTTASPPPALFPYSTTTNNKN